MNRGRSHKNLASPGNGQQFDEERDSQHFTRCCPSAFSRSWYTRRAILTWPVWGLPSLSSAPISHCKSTVSMILRENLFVIMSDLQSLPVSVGVGRRDTVWWGRVYWSCGAQRQAGARRVYVP